MYIPVFVNAGKFPLCGLQVYSAACQQLRMRRNMYVTRDGMLGRCKRYNYFNVN